MHKELTVGSTSLIIRRISGWIDCELPSQFRLFMNGHKIESAASIRSPTERLSDSRCH